MTQLKEFKEISPKIGFNQVLKSPPTYMLIVAVSLMWFFVYQFTGTSDQVNINCESEKRQLRAELTQARAEKDQLTTALLIKNGIIYKQEQEKMEIDSALREGPGKKAKKIIKEN